MQIRTRELQELVRRFYLYTFGAISWFGAPLLLTVVTFGAYTLIAGHELKASVAFSSLSLINVVRTPIERLGNSITDLMNAKVSLDRMQAFMEEEPTEKYHVLSQPRGPDSPFIGFKCASFRWGSSSDSTKLSLQNLSIEFPIGKLSVIIGPTGVGKSSLLMALLGEMSLVQGNVFLPGNPALGEAYIDPTTGYTDTVAYCSQRPWLINSTIRNNILFGSKFDEARYRRVISACCLLTVFQSLEQGDLTTVGDKGITLSGGQKQRIALARAVYSSAKHLLIDGCLEAIDAHSSRSIFNNCLMGPLMFARTCILVSHNFALTVPSATLVVALRDGSVEFQGTPQDAVYHGVLGSDHHGIQQSISTRSTTPFEQNCGDEVEDCPAPNHNQFTVRKDSDMPLSIESRKVGNVGWLTYVRYFKYMGTSLYWALLIGAFILQQAGDFMHNWWIRRWSQGAVEVSTAKQGTGYYLCVYISISVIYLLISGARNALAFYGSLTASKSVFPDLLSSVMHAKPRFFHTTPIGVIINRFSKDMETIDLILMTSLISMAHSITSISIILSVITVILPRFLFIIGFIGAIFFLINNYFTRTSVELRRMRLVTRSPLYQHFAETLSGLATIRAYGHESRFMFENMEKLDVHTRPYNAMWACDRWMKFRCDVLGGLITALAAGFIIWRSGTIDAGLAGLCMTYATSFTGEVSYLLAVNATNEMNMNSVERVEEFLELEQENTLSDTPSISQDWPRKGGIRVQNLSLRYAPNLPKVINRISFKVDPGWKVGIVGRTGAGKSTLAQAFFRFLEADEGSIMIDGVDIKTIGLKDLREALTIIPQGKMGLI